MAIDDDLAAIADPASAARLQLVIDPRRKRQRPLDFASVVSRVRTLIQRSHTFY
jgi:hypothetical protein